MSSDGSALGGKNGNIASGDTLTLTGAFGTNTYTVTATTTVNSLAAQINADSSVTHVNASVASNGQLTLSNGDTTAGHTVTIAGTVAGKLGLGGASISNSGVVTPSAPLAIGSSDGTAGGPRCRR